MASWRRKSNMDLFRWIDFWLEVTRLVLDHPLHSSFKGYTFLLYWYPLLYPLTLRYVLRTTQCPWKIKKSTRRVIYALNLSFVLIFRLTQYKYKRNKKSAPSLKLQRKRKARDCCLVRKPFTSYNSRSIEPFHPLLIRCFVSDFSTTSKKKCDSIRSRNRNIQDLPPKLGGGVYGNPLLLVHV